jgi:phosphatidylinositol glycan class B
MYRIIATLPQFKDNKWLGHFKKALFIGVLFHLLAIIFSDGFHRPDEHLGIMRFTGFKLGMLNSSQAFNSWEYPAQIRPWLQPFLYATIIAPVKALGLENPFTIATLLRAFSSLLGLIASLFIAFISYDFSKNDKTRLIALYSSFILWFIPFFHARTSAENLSSSLFTYAFIIIYLNRNAKVLSYLVSISTGFLFALSFITRYQASISIFFLCLWLLLIKKEKVTSLFIVTLTFFITLGASAFIDHSGYGTWTNPAYNYFYENIVNNKAAHFGVDPWWKYLTKSITKGIPPLSLFYFLATFYFWIKKPRHILTWVTLPFLILHSCIAHKELRFIFPILIYLPLLVSHFIDRYQLSLKRYYLFKVLLTINCIALLIASLKPVYSPLSLYKFIYRQQGPKIETIYTTHNIRDQLHFYLRKNTKFVVLDDSLPTVQDNLWVMSDNKRDFDRYEAKENCVLAYSSYPAYLIRNYPSFFKRSKIFALYQCESL